MARDYATLRGHLWGGPRMSGDYLPGTLVRARGREWVVLPESRGDVLRLRPLGGSDEDASLIYVPLEHAPPEPAVFPPPRPEQAGTHTSALLLRDALRLTLRAGAGPFRSLGRLAVEPRAYQLVPLLMALKQEVVRLLIADDVGVGKTIEAALIARELLDRGEIQRLSVLTPPHLCEQWQQELAGKFGIRAEVVRTGTARRLERGLPAGRSLFEAYPYTIVSLDYIKSDRRRDEFARACPEFVIVEEAHSCAQGAGSARHQRFQLLKTLAADDKRHLVMLTATPHSGNDEAFYNLLGLLDSRFRTLPEVAQDERAALREALSGHFVQRRRPDIAEWKDATLFPDRQTREATYMLTGEWGALFRGVLGYAQALVHSTEHQGQLQRRMSWWAALALLRCISSSPAAARIALETRIRATLSTSVDEQMVAVETEGLQAVLDGEADDLLAFDEGVPAGQVGEVSESLQAFAAQAERLQGVAADPKLAGLVRELELLLADGFQPVVFCRYIATADYLARELTTQFAEKGVTVRAVTSERTPEERQGAVEDLAREGRRILVATDCLSEGINIQSAFDAVVHYDLSWNPTRHEQREGRVDRFGQPRPTVRCVLYYGQNNPVDGGVLRVILRKAERIRRELGVAVPFPEDSQKVMEAVMEAVLLKGEAAMASTQQMDLDFGAAERTVERAWESARDKARESRTLFAQKSLHPETVLPEWVKTQQILGGETDVLAFVRQAMQRLQAPLEPVSPQEGREPSTYRLPLAHLPAVIRERLAQAGWPYVGHAAVRLGFHHPVPAGCEYVHRTHALVSVVADYLTERALAGDDPELAARCAAIFTDAVSARTTVYLLRLRAQITVKYGEAVRHLLAEDCVTVAVTSGHQADAPGLTVGDEALQLLAARPVRNMAPEHRARLIQGAIDGLAALAPSFNALAERRAEDVLSDHKRVRAAADARGWRYDVRAALPVDIIGVYVLLPAVQV